MAHTFHDASGRPAAPTEAVQEAVPPAWVRDYYACVDANDGPGALSRMAEDVVIQFGVRPVAYGRQSAARTLRDVHARFTSVSHFFRNVWELGEDTVICEFVATYRFANGSTRPLPTMTLLERRNGLLVTMRVYIDETAIVPIGA